MKRIPAAVLTFDAAVIAATFWASFRFLPHADALPVALISSGSCAVIAFLAVVATWSIGNSR